MLCPPDWTEQAKKKSAHPNTLADISDGNTGRFALEITTPKPPNSSIFKVERTRRLLRHLESSFRQIILEAEKTESHNVWCCVVDELIQHFILSLQTLKELKNFEGGDFLPFGTAGDQNTIESSPAVVYSGVSSVEKKFERVHSKQTHLRLY